MSFQIQQAVVFFEEVADFGINCVIGLPVGSFLGELPGPMRLQFASKLPSEDGIRQVHHCKKPVLVLELAAMKVSVEIGSSVGSRPVQDFGTVSASIDFCNSMFLLNAGLLGES